MSAVFVEALNILIKPVAESSGSSTNTKDGASLQKMLQANLTLLEEKLHGDPRFQDVQGVRAQVRERLAWCEWSQDVTWNFVVECLLLLLSLKHCLKSLLESFVPTKPNQRTPEAAPALPPDVLSITQQKTVGSGLQFVVTLGICPYLLPGVGVPLSRRSAFGAAVESAVFRDVAPDGSRRLFTSCSALLELVEVSSLGTLVLTRHLGDILAGLCQLGHCPTRSRAQLAVLTEKAKCSVEKLWTGLPNHTSASTEIGKEERMSCKRALQGLLGKVYQPIVIKELLILQGGPKQVKLGAVRGSRQPLAPAPPWLRSLCGQLLSDRLAQPSGVQAVVRGILEGAGAGAVGGMDAEAAASDWRKCDSVARILSACPQQSLSVDDYYRQVCPQVLELLHIRDKLTALQFQRVATTTVLSMIQQQHSLADEHLLTPLLSPLLRCLTLAEEKPSMVSVSESDLSQCIEDLFKVCVVGNSPTPALLKALGNVIPVIFSLYCFTKQNVSHLRSPCHEILQWFLLKTDTNVAIGVLEQLCSLSGQRTGNLPVYQFLPGSDGGARVSLRELISDEDDALYEKLSFEQWRVECVVDLLASLEESDLPGDFFISLLKELTSLAEEVEEAEEEAVPTSSMSLLQLEMYQEQCTAKQEQRLLVLQVLAVMCEKLSHTLLHNPGQVVEFIAAMLRRVCACLERGIEGTVETQTLTMGLGLVATMLGGAAKLKSEDYTAMAVLLPLLDLVSRQHPDTLVQELATDLRATIATHGAYMADSMVRAARSGSSESSNRTAGSDTAATEAKQDEETARQREQAKRPVERGAGMKAGSVMAGGQDTGTESLAPPEGPPSHPADMQGLRPSRPDPPPLQPRKHFSECVLEAYDPDIPTRAFALRTLTSMVHKKEAQALNSQEKILTLFLENLEHEDPFVYLSAIQGLAVLADVFPEQILRRLLDEYQQGPPDSRKPRSLETRLKVGEVLMRASRALGDLASHYGGPLINVFLRRARDEDSMMRASSLSNLGELCQRLNFALGPMAHELSWCLSAILKTDREAEVRRAAVHVIALLLRGLSDRSMQVLSEVLRDLYRALKLVVQMDRDDITVLHAQLALEELDDVVRRFIFPEQKLEKKIVVLP
ncbi:transport and Golgi organization protein 6 homolog isoform X1 [Amia ocellicauda]|uniref:transport and Golgi organization protein 6 homolog isoform X1 n=1 Tax=Amia ocellicauda TaxID=2972642 RepID=UPI0034640E6E